MRAAWNIALKDLRQRIRDHSAIAVALVAPLVLAAVMGLSLGGSGGLRMRLVVADLGAARAGADFTSFVADSALGEIVDLRTASTPGEAEAIVADGDAEAAVVFAPEFAPGAGRAAGVEIVTGSNNPFAARSTESLVRDFVVRGTPAGARAGSVVALSPGGRLRLIDFFAASMAVLFLTFAVLSGVRALQTEIDMGTMTRLRAAPATPVAIFAGKFGALLAIGLVQMAVMIAATGALFGTPWGNPLPVAALVLTSALMAVGLTSFFVSLARNAEQGQGIASIGIFLLAVIGGQFMPPQGLPEVFDTLNRLTPNGQAFRGFTDLAAAGANGTLATIAEPLWVTAGVGLAGIAVAVARARRALERMS